MTQYEIQVIESLQGIRNELSLLADMLKEVRDALNALTRTVRDIGEEM